MLELMNTKSQGLRIESYILTIECHIYFCSPDLQETPLVAMLSFIAHPQVPRVSRRYKHNKSIIYLKVIIAYVVLLDFSVKTQCTSNPFKFPKLFRRSH